MQDNQLLSAHLKYLYSPVLACRRPQEILENRRIERHATTVTGTRAKRIGFIVMEPSNKPLRLPKPPGFCKCPHLCPLKGLAATSQFEIAVLDSLGQSRARMFRQRILD
jgi:hypothetical protein